MAICNKITQKSDSACGAKEMYLLMYDKEEEKIWDEKILTEREEHDVVQVLSLGSGTNDFQKKLFKEIM
jgi:hypothetical protein